MEFEDCENIANLLNLFMIYFKRKNDINDGSAMFDNIDRTQINIHTNVMLEEFYEVIQEYKVAKFKESCNYNEEFIKENDEIELFVLTINDQKVKVSDSLMSLLIDINNNYLNQDWNIV
jgi:hypothetical protein